MTMPAQFPALQQRGLAKFIKLALDFSANEVLDPRITFSRTSNATRTNAQGLIEYAPHNLLTYSEQFDNAAWLFAAPYSITPNVITGPGGTTTADAIVLDSGSTSFNSNIPRQSITKDASAIQYTHSCYVKAKGTTTAVRLSDFGLSTANTAAVIVSLIDGSVISAPAVSGTFTEASVVVESLQNGWFRVALTYTTDTATTLTVRHFPYKGSAQLIGDGTSGIYLWGAQLNIGSLQPYYTTSVKNLLGYSQNFENAAWAKSNSTIDATPVMGPLGFLGAEKLVEDTATGPHSMQQTAITAETSIFTASLYCKAGEKQYVQLRVSDTSPTSGSRAYATFDLLNGTYNVGSITATNVTASIIQLNSGWYRCTLTCGLVITGTTTLSNIYIANSATASSAPPTYTGDGTSGIYIFGAQLSDSASLDPYVYNFDAAPTSTAYYGPRFDYDPVTLAPKGLLIEEQRVNSIRNNTMQGAVVGTPGTLPTNYTYTGGGLVANVVGIGYEGGINYVDIQFVGTATFGSSGLRFEGNAGVGASTGQTWNTSLYVRKISGTTSGISSLWSSLTYLIAGASSDAITKAIPFDTLDLTSIAYNRQDVTLTAVTSGITTVRPQLVLGHNIGANIDITLRIGMPQLEQGAFPTSVIPTTTTQVTRAADNASMVGTNFSSWYNQSEGTLFAQANIINAATDVRLFDIADATSIDMGLRRNNTNTCIYVIRTPTALDVNLSPTFTQGNIKMIGAYSPTSCAAAYNGLPPTSGAGLSGLFTVNQAWLGRVWNGTGYLNGHLKSCKFFSKRFINTYLQRLTQ